MRISSELAQSAFQLAEHLQASGVPASMSGVLDAYFQASRVAVGPSPGHTPGTLRGPAAEAQKRIVASAATSATSRELTSDARTSLVAKLNEKGWLRTAQPTDSEILDAVDDAVTYSRYYPPVQVKADAAIDAEYSRYYPC